MFGQIAPRYDLLNHVLSLGIDRRWRRRTVEATSTDGDGPVLDVCTGTGDLALEYWRAGRGSRRVVGADFCWPMLAIAGQKRRRLGAGQLELVAADTARLPFPDNMFQVVSVAFGLRNVSDTDRGLAEMVRVCRPGGRVAVLEFSMPRGRVLGGLYGWYFHRLLPRIGQAVARNRQGAYNYLPASVGEFPQAEAMCRRMEAAGLGSVECRRLTFGVASLYVGVK